MPFEFTPSDTFDGLVLVTAKAFPDSRGYFLESYTAKDFLAAGIPEFVQENHSVSKKGVIRGLHYQKEPFAQGKLVRVVVGDVLDVFVDLRKDSSTFGNWGSVRLCEGMNKMLYIPPGFAHGFLSLEDNTHLLYKVTAPYSPAHDAGVLWCDDGLGIDWGLEGFCIKKPIVSEKDQKLPCLTEFQTDIF